MFRIKKGVRMDYVGQGYVYFTSRMYNRLPAEKKLGILAHCCNVGGEHSAALLEYVTTATSPERICQKHYISRSTLYRVVKKYYETFPKEL